LGRLERVLQVGALSLHARTKLAEETRRVGVASGCLNTRPHGVGERSAA
jgi:hypothetical protein